MTEQEAFAVAVALRKALERASSKKAREGVILAGTEICDLLLVQVEGLDEAKWMGAWCYPTEQERKSAQWRARWGS